MLSSERALALVRKGGYVRVRSGALGCERTVMAEGRVIGYYPAPTIVIEHADGTRSSWSVDLPIDEVPDA